jgi:hypothetical protein
LNPSTPYITVRLLSLILFGWTFLSTAAAAADNPSNGRSFGQVVEVGKIANHAIVELSGLACSRLNEKVLWAVNDGGNQPLLFPVGSDGADLGSVSIIGADNRDWEDVASFMLGNTAYLLIADVGDNFGNHKSSTHQVYLFIGRTGENWPTVFSRTPRILRFPALLQQEAICFSKNGKSVYISSEGRSAPLLRIDLDTFTSSQ